jgi:hypothetical protein
MFLLNDNWLLEPPRDYELKKYQLLSAIQSIMKMIDDGDLYSALKIVEENLYNLYKFQSDKGALNDDLKILKGINLDTMSLDFEYPEETEEMEELHILCDYAIDEFESVFKIVRSKWRSLSNKISLTEIPSARPTKTKGKLLVTRKGGDSIIIYDYDSKKKSDWRDIKVEKSEVIDNELGKLSEYIQNVEDSENYRFWRCDHTIDYDVDSCVIPLIKHSLFFKIVSA